MINKKKILIIGANGFLGRRLLTKFSSSSYKVYGADITISGIPSQFNPTEIDITNVQKVNFVFSKIQPDLTILTAAMTNVDQCEDKPDLAFKINADGPKNVAQAVKKINGRMVQISTDFIFDGKRSGGNYREEEEAHPISVYGESKLTGEKNVLKTGVTALICRTSVLFGWPESDQRDNFFSWAYKQLKSGKHLTIIDGQITCPTLVDDLVEFLFQISDFKESTIYHTTGPEAISRYEFVKKVIDVFNFDQALLQKISSFKQKAARPANSSLDTSKIQNLNKNGFRNITESFIFLKKHIPTK
ncbi:MAG: SDR family oxidoreductase [Promethearchaeota archaeon]